LLREEIAGKKRATYEVAQMPCVLLNREGSTLFVRIPPDEISETTEEGDHQPDRDHPCEYHIIDEHDSLPPRLFRCLMAASYSQQWLKKLTVVNSPASAENTRLGS
jgi:hypothetical protein